MGQPMRISPLLAFDECARGVESESPAGLVGEGKGGGSHPKP